METSVTMEFLGIYLDLKTYAIYVCRIMLSVLGISLNGMNILVLCLSPRKISPMGRFVINLAFADISVCLCDLWSILLVVIYHNQLSSSAFCAISFYTFLQHATFLATLLSVIMIATNNYFMVLKPLEHGSVFTRKFVNRSAVVIWSFAVVLSCLAVILPGIIQDDVSLKKNFNFKFRNSNIIENEFMGPNTNASSEHFAPVTESQFAVSENMTTTEHIDIEVLNVHSNFVARSLRKFRIAFLRAASRVRHNNISGTANRLDIEVDELISYLNTTKLSLCDKMYFNFVFDPYLIFTLGTFLCLFLMLFAYIRICFEIRKYSRRAYTMAGQKVNQSRSTVTTFLMVLSFIVCWIPCSVNFLVIFFNDSLRLESNVIYRNTVFIFQLLNTIVDPILYAFRLPEVRRDYLSLINRCRYKKVLRHKTNSDPCNCKSDKGLLARRANTL